MPARIDGDDYYAQLPDQARPHMVRLREVSLAAASDVEEKRAWNSPAYHRDGVRLWMLQSFSRHCSLRFPTCQFGPHRDEVTEAGYEDGEGFIRLPFDRELPDALCARLIGYRLADFARNATTWSG